MDVMGFVIAVLITQVRLDDGVRQSYCSRKSILYDILNCKLSGATTSITIMLLKRGYKNKGRLDRGGEGSAGRLERFRCRTEALDRGADICVDL